MLYKATVNVHIALDRFLLNEKIQKIKYELNNKERKDWIVF